MSVLRAIKTPSISANVSRKRTVVCNAVFAQDGNRLASAIVGVGAAVLLTASPALASVSFSNIKDGAKVPSPVHVEFAVKGKEVKAVAAGDLSDASGHFHVIIDGNFVPKGEAIPFDATHLHYGKAQTSADLELAPGKHVITLQFADIKHESYGKDWAQTINLTVN